MSTTFGVVTLDGQQHTGLDEATVRDWYQRHFLRDHSFVIVWGSTEWKPLYQVFDLRQWQLAPAGQAPAPSPDAANTSAPQPQPEIASALLPPGSYVPQPTQPYNYYQKPVVFASALGLGIATIVGLAAEVVTRIIHLATYYSNDVYIMSRSGRSIAPPDVAQTAYLLYGLFVVVFIATGVIYSLWVYRAYKNLRALGHTYTDFTPGWAVGYFFVPVVNLWKPYQAVSEIWEKSDPSESTSGSALVIFWWVCFLLTGSANWLGATLISSSNSLDFIPLVIVSMIANIFAAILLTAIIVGVHLRQEKRARIMKEDPAQLNSSSPHSSPYSLLG